MVMLIFGTERLYYLYCRLDDLDEISLRVRDILFTYVDCIAMEILAWVVFIMLYVDGKHYC
jgi:hypothetical protein